MPGKMLWIDSLHNLDTPTAGQTVTSLMFGVSNVQTRFDQMTLLRTIICHDYASAVLDSGEGSQILDIGIAVTSQEAFAASAVPDPNVDTDFPTRGWIYRCRHRLVAFAADAPAADVIRINKDIRSKRKLENGECYLVINNTALTGTTFTARLIGITRQLWLVR